MSEPVRTNTHKALLIAPISTKKVQKRLGAKSRTPQTAHSHSHGSPTYPFLQTSFGSLLGTPNVTSSLTAEHNDNSRRGNAYTPAMFTPQTVHTPTGLTHPAGGMTSNMDCRQIWEEENWDPNGEWPLQRVLKMRNAALTTPIDPHERSKRMSENSSKANYFDHSSFGYITPQSPNDMIHSHLAESSLHDDHLGRSNIDDNDGLMGISHHTTHSQHTSVDHPLPMQTQSISDILHQGGTGEMENAPESHVHTNYRPSTQILDDHSKPQSRVKSRQKDSVKTSKKSKKRSPNKKKLEELKNSIPSTTVDTKKRKRSVMEKYSFETTPLDYPEDRQYRIVSNQASYFPDSLHPSQMNIQLKTRSDPPNRTVPEKLYSSLKYELTMKIPGHCLVRERLEDSTPVPNGVFMIRLRVVDPENHDSVVTKPNGDQLVGGIAEHTAMNVKDEAIDVFLKMRFTDVSAHHNKRDLALRIEIFDSGLSIEDPILSIVSAPFQIYARRPKQNRRQKRSKTESTQEEDDEEDYEEEERPTTSSSKKSRTVNGSSIENTESIDVGDPTDVSLEAFRMVLSQLKFLKSRMSEEEKDKAIHMVKQRFETLEDFTFHHEK